MAAGSASCSGGMNSPGQSRFGEAQGRMTGPRPAVLYKYLNAEGAKDFLKAPQVRFKDWRKLDDSMEVVPGFRAYAEAEVDALATKMANETLVPREKCAHYLRTTSLVDPAYLEGQMRKEFLAQESTLFVCSLTARPESGAMWAHYAENHRGIVFGLAGAIDRLCQMVPCGLERMTYSEHRPQITFPIADRGALREAVFTKCEDWRYQAEWRLVANKASTAPLAVPEVAEIIVGFDVCEEITNLAVALKAQGVKVAKAYPDPAFHRVAFKAL